LSFFCFLVGMYSIIQFLPSIATTVRRKKNAGQPGRTIKDLLVPNEFI